MQAAAECVVVWVVSLQERQTVNALNTLHSDFSGQTIFLRLTKLELARHSIQGEPLRPEALFPGALSYNAGLAEQGTCFT